MLSSQNGWRLALWFSVVLNVNLALLNLLPVPLFDGGHILMASHRDGAAQTGQHPALGSDPDVTCFVVVVGYMLYVARPSIVVDLVSGGRSHRNMEFRTPAATPAASPVK